MTVYVYSTGSVLKTSNTGAQVRATINNRTTETQQFRLIVWNTSSGVKTAIDDFTSSVNANNTAERIIDFGNGVSSYEVEFRFLSAHVAPYLQQRYADLFSSSIFEPVYAGELFQDSTNAESL